MCAMYKITILFLSILFFTVEVNALKNWEQMSKKTTISKGLNLYQWQNQLQTKFVAAQSTLLSFEQGSYLLQCINNAVEKCYSDCIVKSLLNTVLINSGEIGESKFDVGYRVYAYPFGSEHQVTHWNKKINIKRECGMGKVQSVNASSMPFFESSQMVSLLELVPSKFKGKVRSVLAQNRIKNLSTVSDMAKDNNAIAAINGGFFVFDESQGTVGDLGGIAVIDGVLASEAVKGRPALLIRSVPELEVTIAHDVSTNIQIELNGVQIVADGLNRKLGKRFNCGVTRLPIHDQVCEQKEEIVVFNHLYGEFSLTDVNATSAFKVNLDSTIELVNEPTFSITLERGEVVVAITDGLKKVLLDLATNTTANVTYTVSSKNKKIPLERGVYMVNGGPTLLKSSGFALEEWEEEGWSPSSNLGQDVRQSYDERDALTVGNVLTERANFFESWINRRHPRSAVGIGPHGDVYFVTSYGRRPGYADGHTVYELAQLMKDIGAVDAINLDGGGSAAMFVAGKLTGIPSDKAGERQVADSIIFEPIQLQKEDKKGKANVE